MNKSPNLTSLVAEKNVSPRHAFTLVELMVVIVIIGIIAAFALPAIFSAVTSARQSAYKLEIDTLADAVEKYRTKYGDYPPDGSSWPIMERHLRKAFPQILQSELNLLNPNPTVTAYKVGTTSHTTFEYQGWDANVNNPWLAVNVAGVRNDFDQTVTISNGYAATDLKVMDPAEALVFFLGGFSSNPQRPFTGIGGPFVVTAGSPGDPPPNTGLSGGQTLQYNVQRANSFFDFKLDRLSIDQNAAGLVVSVDEAQYLNLALANDLLPVYLNRADIENSSPVVYFDSRTYAYMKGGAYYSNFYQRASTMAMNNTLADDEFGAIRPVVSSIIRTPPIPTATRTDADWIKANTFFEDRKFQVLGAGLDDKYGGLTVRDLTFDFMSTPTVSQVIAAFLNMPSGKSNIVTGSPGAGPASSRVYDRLLLPRTSDLYNRSTEQLDNAANCLEGSTFFNSLSVPGK